MHPPLPSPLRRALPLCYALLLASAACGESPTEPPAEPPITLMEDEPDASPSTRPLVDMGMSDLASDLSDPPDQPEEVDQSEAPDLSPQEPDMPAEEEDQAEDMTMPEPPERWGLPEQCWIVRAPACNPVDNAGCDGVAGEACAIGQGDGGSPALMCFPAPNTAAVGQSCDNANGPFCVAGAVCDGNTKKCASFCCANGDCAAGETCQALTGVGTLGSCASSAPQCARGGRSCRVNSDCCSNDCHSGHCH